MEGGGGEGGGRRWRVWWGSRGGWRGGGREVKGVKQGGGAGGAGGGGRVEGGNKTLSRICSKNSHFRKKLIFGVLFATPGARGSFCFLGQAISATCNCLQYNPVTLVRTPETFCFLNYFGNTITTLRTEDVQSVSEGQCWWRCNRRHIRVSATPESEWVETEKLAAGRCGPCCVSRSVVITVRSNEHEDFCRDHGLRGEGGGQVVGGAKIIFAPTFGSIVRTPTFGRELSPYKRLEGSPTLPPNPTFPSSEDGWHRAAAVSATATGGGGVTTY